MSSSAEQMIDHICWKDVFRRARTWKTIGFVFLAAITLRLGSFIPLPGVENYAWSQFWVQSPFAKMLGLL